MKKQLLAFYNNNKRKILVIIICILILIAIPRILEFIVNFTKKEPGDLGVINQTVQNTLNTSVIESEESVISGEKIYAEQEAFIKLIDNFVEQCNNGNLEQAYSLLSTDCQQELYPTIESFKNNYYDRVFNQTKKTALIENWISNIYKIDYTNDILSSGLYDEDSNIQDYISVVDENGEIRLNINSYIGETAINRNTSYLNINVNIISKKVYMDYEVYKFKIQNNSGNDILLDDQQSIDTMYIEDENGNKYDAYMHELTNSSLTIPDGAVREIEIKYYNKYNSNKTIRKVVFSKVVLNNYWYSALESKSSYNYYGIIEIGL